MKKGVDSINRFDPTVLTMAIVRLISSLIELTAALLMLWVNDVKKAVVINSTLAVVGPFIFIITMTIGIYHIADELSYSKLIFIVLGVCFILYGIFK
ncbi:YqhV family protein [Bacillus kexueae]|uniref:YqhV family protein n=1 Tax=Aeribacillus kexueae TaxID=2078952 RepID=UPI001FB0137A|nr:YqhV family protein [Bacillus kexueae]